MQYIGFHVSASGGLDQSVIRAHNLNMSAFAFFTKNQIRWNAKSLSATVIKNFREKCTTLSYKNHQIIPHGSYLINLGHPNALLLEKSRIALIDEIKRCYQLGLMYLNVHPGNHLNQITEDKCLENISESINIACMQTNKVIIIIENTAGQGSSVGYNFNHLSKIINNITDKSRIGVCLDTCHLFASGYDLSSNRSCNNLLDNFDKKIGIKYLKVIHLNDAKCNFNSKVDRHHSLGLGKIGITLFKWVMNNPYFLNLPIIVESIDSTLWQKELLWLRSLVVK
ncbi:Endonuclease 4 [Buchnera aphidicola (Thelaxes suberi)]|uniref:deoxyribonuclease IV n=1 Tax=Buchnera aphidicola TaxID=9 RepID=UPI00346439BE